MRGEINTEKDIISILIFGKQYRFEILDQPFIYPKICTNQISNVIILNQLLLRLNIFYCLYWPITDTFSLDHVCLTKLPYIYLPIMINLHRRVDTVRWVVRMLNIWIHQLYMLTICICYIHSLLQWGKWLVSTFIYRSVYLS